MTTLALPTPASADAVQVTGGTAVIVNAIGDIDLVGERGFSLSAMVDEIGGISFPSFQCDFPTCVPGKELSLFATWTGNDLPATVTFEGQTFTRVGGQASHESASVEFSGSFIAPPFAQSAQVTAPFRFTGRFQFATDPSGAEIIRHTLFGAGVATINLFPAFPGNGAWGISSVRYEFSADEVAPVPEPATMLMVGLGLAGAARRWRRPPAAEA
jgi:hypothetical protein